MRIRNTTIALSRNVYINEPIHTELSTMNKLIPSHIPIQFQFGINKISKFLQYKEGNYEVKFSKFYIVYETVDLAPKLLYEVESKFNAKKRGIFPICRGLVKTHQFPSAAGSVLWSNLYQGILPETITICMMDAKAYNSAPDKNYFNLKKKKKLSVNLKKIYFSVNLKKNIFSEIVLKNYSPEINNEVSKLINYQAL